MLSSYFEARNRRADRLENEAHTERRHQEILDAEARREERLEERRLEERREERRQEEERRRQDAEAAERRHQELMTALIAALSNGRNHTDSQNQSQLIQTLRQTIEALESENASLRRQNGNDGHSTSQEPPGNDG